MAVARYDAKKHHVGLGPSDPGDQYGFSISGYVKQGQQYGGNQAYGGVDSLISIPTLSRWTQEDFSGGDGQHVWGADPAMFSACHGMLPQQLGRSIRTSPPLIKVAAASADVGQRAPLGSFTFNAFIWHVYTNGVTKTDLHTGAVTYFSSITGGNTSDIITGFVFDPSKKALIVCTNTGSVEGYSLPGVTSNAYTATGLLSGPAAGDNTKNQGLGLIGNKLILCRDRVIYTLTLVDNQDSYAFTDTDWKAPTNNRLPGTWKDSFVYNNFLYILVSDIDDGTRVLYYDPGLDTVFNVCTIPYSFTGTCIFEYGGRVYVGGSGRDLGGNAEYAELYEVTGTTVRLVRSYAPESRSTSVSHPDDILSMSVCDGFLFFGNKGKCLTVYDITTDSFYDGPGLLNPDGVQLFHDLHAARGNVYSYLVDPLDATKTGLYRIAVSGDSGLEWTSTFVTSEFAPEVDRRKRWSQLRVFTRFGGVAAGYSFTGGAPGGDTFIDLPVVATDTHGDNVITTFDLSEVELTENIRLRFSFDRTDPGTFTELAAFTLSFVMLDTGKRVWNFTVNATQYVEARDRTPEVQNVHDIDTELWRYYLERVPLDFTDVDGGTYKVTLTSLSQSRPIIGPEVDLQPEGSYESLIGVQLIEV